MRLSDFISYEALEFWFSDMDEVLEKDLTAVHVLGIFYSKSQFIDISVDAFGIGGIASMPIYSETIPLESNKVTSVQPIPPLFVIDIFDSRLLQLFSKKELCLHWNPEGSSPVKIDPLNPDSSMELFPEKYEF